MSRIHEHMNTMNFTLISNSYCLWILRIRQVKLQNTFTSKWIILERKRVSSIFLPITLAIWRRQFFIGGGGAFRYVVGYSPMPNWSQLTRYELNPSLPVVKVKIKHLQTLVYVLWGATLSMVENHWGITWTNKEHGFFFLKKVKHLSSCLSLMIKQSGKANLPLLHCDWGCW